MFFLFNESFKSYIKKNIYLFIFLNFTFKNLPHFIKKVLLPHEFDYNIVKKINRNRKLKILDIGGGYGESIVSFYKMSKNIEVETYEPNFNNYIYCKKLERYYPSLKVYNFAYGMNNNKNFLLIPKYRNFIFDNFSGLNILEIKKNFKSLFNVNKVEFTKQKIKFKKSNKKFDLIKVDCETDFYKILKALTPNIKKSTILMIENNKDIIRILNFLKNIEKSYECYYFFNSNLVKLKFFNFKRSKNILNFFFIPKKIRIKSSN